MSQGHSSLNANWYFTIVRQNVADKVECSLQVVDVLVLTENRRINKLEQSLKKQDYDRDHPASSLGSVVGAASTSWFNQTKDTMSAQAPTQKQLINVDTATRPGGSIVTVP